MKATIVKKRETSASKAMLFLVIPFAFLFVSSQTQTCPLIGVEAGVETLNRSLDAASGEHYLLTGKGVINCNGVIREWVFHSNAVCSSGTGTIVFEVWKPSTPVSTTYELIGTNTFSSADCISTDENIVTFGIAPVDRIPVAPGYTIGWYQDATALQISYDVVTDSKSLYSDSAAPLPSLGGPMTFQAAAELRDFSLKVTVIEGDYPTLDNLPSSVNVKEDVPVGTLVFTVLASHISNIQNPDAVPLNFSLSPDSLPFSLTNPSNRNATVETTAALNYEALKTYQLSITVTVLGLSTTEVLTVNVIDVNEPFSITNLPTTINVPATSTSAGDQVFLVIISDSDVSPALPVKFFLENWTSPDTIQDIPPFTINPDTGSVVASVSLDSWYLQHPLNSPPYPSSITYDIAILATDGVYKDSEFLSIIITDVKQPPVFLNLPSTIQIDENIPGNAVIYEVLVAKTTDPILLFQLTTALMPFCIDELSGVISLCSYAKLNYCITPQYDVNVTATNSVMSSTSLLTVSLRKINVSPNFTPAVYSGSVNEKCLPTGSCVLPPISVMWVTVTDPDLYCPPYPESLTCSIISGLGSQFFDIVNCQTVRNILPIDADSDPFYENINLLIEAQDSNSLTTFATIHVSVINVNDYSPIFTQPTYNGSVQENANGGTPVLSVMATDGDHGRNGEFLYSIYASDPLFLYFQVDPQSGLISTKQPLDIENPLIPSPLILTVWATDRGSPSRTGSAIVTVNVIDINDVRPVIDCTNRPLDEPYPPLPCFYNYDLKYDALIGQNVSYLTFSATDVDPQPNSITFNLLVPDHNFDMSIHNGLISVKKSVQEYTKYLLYVYAKDNGSPSLWSRIMNVRIDTYRPDRQYIDLTVRPKTVPFDQNAFLTSLRNVTYPWFMKIVSLTEFDPNVQKDLIVTVYALAETSTYLSENIVHQKVFVDRDDMLNRLRTNIHGDPADILNVPMLEDEFPVIKVMPTYMNWWLDTVEGIATIVCLSILGLLILILPGVGICKCLGLLCFKEKTPPKPIEAWVDQEPKTVRSFDEDSVRYRSAHGRRESVSTVHSIILDRDL